MAMVWIPSSVQARKMRMAISPRFAAITLLNGIGMAAPSNAWCPQHAWGASGSWTRCSLLAAVPGLGAVLRGIGSGEARLGPARFGEAYSSTNAVAMSTPAGGNRGVG